MVVSYYLTYKCYMQVTICNEDDLAAVHDKWFSYSHMVSRGLSFEFNQEYPASGLIEDDHVYLNI